MCCTKSSSPGVSFQEKISKSEKWFILLLIFASFPSCLKKFELTVFPDIIKVIYEDSSDSRQLSSYKNNVIVRTRPIGIIIPDVKTTTIISSQGLYKTSSLVFGLLYPVSHWCPSPVNIYRLRPLDKKKKTEKKQRETYMRSPISGNHILINHCGTRVPLPYTSKRKVV